MGEPGDQSNAIGTAKLSLAGHTLTIAGGNGRHQGFTLDTSTFQVKKS